MESDATLTVMDDEQRLDMCDFMRRVPASAISGFGTTIAARYTRAPLVAPGAERGWAILRDDTMLWADQIRQVMDVRVSRSGEPYEDAADLFADIKRGRIVVSSANSDHPVWTVEENVAFRLVHDVLGHGVTGGGFDWAGEIRACEAHALSLPLEARRALFTECIAQTAHAIFAGFFAEQKVAYLDAGFDLAGWGASAKPPMMPPTVARNGS